MFVSSEIAGDAFREQLARAARSTFYLRIVFSSALLALAGFGPGLLLRFPIAGSFAAEPLVQFYAVRPVIYALLLVAVVCVLAVLCRRAVNLFEAEFAPCTAQPGSSERERVLRLLRPSPCPFVLSGNVYVDLVIFGAALLAYSFWVVILAETAPPEVPGNQAISITLGSYGLFASVIVAGVVWMGSSRRLRQLVPEHPTSGPERGARES
ncbi:MAG TPA: hypothetical protein VMH22_11895 [bacterium]|nr:hypothetical protein [bacterium]